MAQWSRFAQDLSSARYPALLAYATLLAGDRASAEDLVSDALIRTFGWPRRFATLGQAEAYTRRAILTTFLDGARKTSSRTRAYVKIAEPDVAHAREREFDEKDELAAAIGRLALQVRACIVLRFYDDLTIADVAERAGIAVGTAKRYLSDGVAALRADLGEPDLDLGPEPADVIPVDTAARRRNR